MSPDDATTPEDERWWAEQNETWHDLDHPEDEPDRDAKAADRESDDQACSAFYSW